MRSWLDGETRSLRRDEVFVRALQVLDIHLHAVIVRYAVAIVNLAHRVQVLIRLTLLSFLEALLHVLDLRMLLHLLDRSPGRLLHDRVIIAQIGLMLVPQKRIV